MAVFVVYIIFSRILKSIFVFWIWSLTRKYVPMLFLMSVTLEFQTDFLHSLSHFKRCCSKSSSVSGAVEVRVFALVSEIE